VALPAAALVASFVTHAWPPGAWADSLALGWRDAATSAASAVVAALVAVPAALAVSSSIARGSRAAWWAAAAPLAAPGALAGAGLIWIWNRDLAWTPYGGFFMLPLAALARFAPMAALAAAAWRMRLDPALLDAGSVYASPARRFLRIELPLMRPGLVAGALAIAAFSVAELPATLLVAPPGWGTIGVRIYNYLHYGSSASAAALSFALMAIMALAAWAAARVWRTWQ